jgi:hypothetical protein
MHDECDTRKGDLADMLAPIFQAETTVLMEVDGWFENMGAICSIQRSVLFAEIVKAIVNEWDLEGPSDLEVSMPDHAGGGLHFLMKSKRGDERKLTWRQLPDEPVDRALFKLVQFMVENEITLPDIDLRGMLSSCDVDEAQDDDKRGRQSGGQGRRGTLH